MNPIAKLGLIGLSLAASACTTTLLDSDKLDYKSAVKGASLDVPPDLTQLSKDSRYVVTGGVTSASSYQGAAATSAVSTTAPAVVGDVRIERSGDQRWLVINRPADKLWDPVREFWQESGFNLTTDQAAIGKREERLDDLVALPLGVLKRIDPNLEAHLNVRQELVGAHGSDG